MSATQTEEKKHVNKTPEVPDKNKKTPTKKKTVKKQPQQEPMPESEASSDEASAQLWDAPQEQVSPLPQASPNAKQYCPQQSPSPPQLPKQPQEMTIPPGKTNMVHDAAPQPLRGRKKMISETIGDQHMKEIQDKRDKEGDEWARRNGTDDVKNHGGVGGGVVTREV